MNGIPGNIARVRAILHESKMSAILALTSAIFPGISWNKAIQYYYYYLKVFTLMEVRVSALLRLMTYIAGPWASCLHPNLIVYCNCDVIMGVLSPSKPPRLLPLWRHKDTSSSILRHQFKARNLRAKMKPYKCFVFFPLNKIKSLHPACFYCFDVDAISATRWWVFCVNVLFFFFH